MQRSFFQRTVTAFVVGVLCISAEIGAAQSYDQDAETRAFYEALMTLATQARDTKRDRQDQIRAFGSARQRAALAAIDAKVAELNAATEAARNQWVAAAVAAVAFSAADVISVIGQTGQSSVSGDGALIEYRLRQLGSEARALRSGDRRQLNEIASEIERLLRRIKP